MEVSPTTAVARTYQYVESVQKVVPNNTNPNKDRIVQTNYVVTVYDNSGRITTTQSSHQIDYLI